MRCGDRWRVRAKKLATDAAVLERGQRSRAGLTATGRLRIKIARETSVRCRWTRSPGRHGTIESREILERVGAGSWERTGAGRTAGPGRTAQKQRREVQRRRRKQLLARRAGGGQVPMSAQVSPQSKFSAVECSAVLAGGSEWTRAAGSKQRECGAVQCSADGGQRNTMCGGNGRRARGGEGQHAGRPGEGEGEI